MNILVNYIGDPSKQPIFQQEILPMIQRVDTKFIGASWILNKVNRNIPDDLTPLAKLILLSQKSHNNALTAKQLIHEGHQIDMVLTCTDEHFNNLKYIPHACNQNSYFTTIKEMTSLRVDPYFYACDFVTFLKLSLFWKMIPNLKKQDHYIWDKGLIKDEHAEEFIWAKWLIMNSIEPRSF